jgi:hypothetical protein
MLSNSDIKINNEFYHLTIKKFKEIYNPDDDNIVGVIYEAMNLITDDSLDDQIFKDIIERMPDFFKEFVSNKYELCGVYYSSIKQSSTNISNICDFLGI